MKDIDDKIELTKMKDAIPSNKAKMWNPPAVIRLGGEETRGKPGNFDSEFGVDLAPS
ncbi:hypothetical protein [Aliikangiella maris]|uniref:Uncharacterized protein n=2 Tax=Aliikangiella maris TaxID=3162458 RepID=A0ABV3MNC8_9GAMM